MRELVGAEDPREAEVDPLVPEHRHPVELRVDRVVRVRDQGRYDRAPLLEVVARRVADDPHDLGAGARSDVLAEAGPEVSDVLADAVVPAEQRVDVASLPDYGVTRRGRPAQAVGREVDADAVAALRVLGAPGHRLVPARRVAVVEVLDDARKYPAVGDWRQQVVGARTLEFDEAEIRAIPADAVLRGCVAEREALAVLCRAEQVAVLLEGPRRHLVLHVEHQVPHLEDVVLVVVKDRADADHPSFPRSLALEDRIQLALLRLVEYPGDAPERVYDPVVDEELLRVADGDRVGRGDG